MLICNLIILMLDLKMQIMHFEIKYCSSGATLPDEDDLKKTWNVIYNDSYISLAKFIFITSS